ncbi:transposase, partial [Variovorax sp. GrIS 2.14]|uniref:IS66 family transposase n=1 Tax=Variovorax sp. GrIS 2.14 TaxID=3071709 RepID=UPI0038F7BE7B
MNATKINDLDGLDAVQLREVLRGLIERAGHQQRVIEAHDRIIATKDREIHFKQTKVDQLTHEIAMLRRWKFAACSERLNAGQRSLLDETLDADIAAIEQELEQLASVPGAEKTKQVPRRAPLPAHLPRTEVHHEPENTTCACGCALQRIGQDMAERLDYVPGVFTVERHIRGKWACTTCQTLMQAPVPAQIIDKGIPTAGLLAQVMVAKYADHLPLYRQESIFGRAGFAIPRSTLGAWVGMCGVQLQPLVDALRSA